ncbi:MAG: hypothetical protein ACREDY_03655 [Bradyrhizobium sp.]
MLTRSDTIAMEGAVVTCPHCHARIGVLRKTLYQGLTFGLDAIRFERGQEPLNDQAACRVCRASYAEIDTHVVDGRSKQTMLVHTDHGWLPRAPPNAPEPPRPPLKPAA